MWKGNVTKTEINDGDRINDENKTEENTNEMSTKEIINKHERYQRN